MIQTLKLSIEIGISTTFLVNILDFIKNDKLSYLYNINTKKITSVILDMLCQIGLSYASISSIETFIQIKPYIACTINILLYLFIYYYFYSFRYFLLNFAFIVASKDTVFPQNLAPNKTIKIKITPNPLPFIEYIPILNYILLSEDLIKQIGYDATSLLIMHKIKINKYDIFKNLLLIFCLFLIPFTIISQLKSQHLPSAFYGVFGIYVVLTYKTLENKYFLNKLLLIDREIVKYSGKAPFIKALNSYYDYLNQQRSFQKIRNNAVKNKRISIINEIK